MPVRKHVTDVLNAVDIFAVINSNGIYGNTDFCSCFLAFAKFGVPPVTEGVKVMDSSGTEVDEDVFAD